MQNTWCARQQVLLSHVHAAARHTAASVRDHQPGSAPTLAAGGVCGAGRLGGAACRALLALGAGGTTLAVVADGALQHGHIGQLVQGHVGVGVEGVGAVGGAVDHTKTALDKAVGVKPLLQGDIAGGTAGRALLAGLAAALVGVEAGRAATGTCRSQEREGGRVAAGQRSHHQPAQGDKETGLSACMQ